jgi:hypothetical protein
MIFPYQRFESKITCSYHFSYWKSSVTATHIVVSSVVIYLATLSVALNVTSDDKKLNE